MTNWNILKEGTLRPTVRPPIRKLLWPLQPAGARGEATSKNLLRLHGTEWRGPLARKLMIGIRKRGKTKKRSALSPPKVLLSQRMDKLVGVITLRPKQ